MFIAHTVAKARPGVFPRSIDNESVKNTSLKATQVIKNIIRVNIVVLSTMIIVGCILTSSSPVIILGSTSVALFSTSSLAAVRVAFPLLVHTKQAKAIEESSRIEFKKKCAGIVCEDTKQSFTWKKRLICEAQQNIVLSGNYCGKESFDEVLDLIKEQMQKKPQLKVVILSSPIFLSASNRERINALYHSFPDRFCLVETDSHWMTSQRAKKITNHTKCLVIDSGKAFLMGGSGIENKYAYATGSGDPVVIPEEYASPNQESPGLFYRLLPRSFRDMDWVFFQREPLGPGSQAYYEALKLAKLWDGINVRLGKQSASRVVQELLESYESTPPQSISAESVTGKEQVVEDMQCEILSSGPEHDKSVFAERVLKHIQEAKEEIYIDHMFFHPSDEILKALAEKANQGVKIVIITNGYGPVHPRTHRAFGTRNRVEIQRLYRMISPKYRKNLHVYEYGREQGNGPRNTTLHKKCIVIDRRYVLAGSSNLGYKSLVTTSDHEMNFCVESQKFAEQTKEVIERDIELAESYDPKQSPSMSAYVFAQIHWASAALIG